MADENPPNTGAWHDLREAAAECREALDRTGRTVTITDPELSRD